MMQHKVVGIISKPSSSRGDHEVKAVLPWLKKKSEILSGCEDGVLKDIVRNCDYRKAVRDDVIVVQGERGDWYVTYCFGIVCMYGIFVASLADGALLRKSIRASFYIMLSGQTSVYIDTLKSDNENNSILTAAMNVDVNIDVTEDPSAEVNLEEDGSAADGKKKKQLDRSKYGKFIIHFDAGKSFGEIALISDDSVRNATVIADEETDMLVIHRDLFNRSMKVQQEKEYQERKEFISKCHLFSSWSTKFKHLLEMSLRKVVYPFDTHIMKQGDPVTGLFFFISGQAKVTTNPAQHKQQYPNLLKTTSLMEQEFGRHNKENVDKKQSSRLIQQQIQVRREEGYAAAEKRQMTKTVDLCCVEGREIQGDLEAVMEMPTYAYTVTATATTTAFVLDDKNYERLVLKKNTHTIQSLKEGVFRKLRARLTIPSACQIPLLKVVHDKLSEELKPKTRVPPKKEVVENNKETIISQMVKLYMQGKTPLIDPLLPDSFYHRLKTEKKNAQIESRSQKKIEHERLFRKRHRTVPRSLKQLQNSAAETELMYPDGEWIQSPSHSKDKILRPRTAIGIEGHSMTDSSASVRPRTAIGKTYGAGNGVFHLTQCESTDDFGQTVSKVKSVSLADEYDQVCQKIDAIQKEKNDTRTKVICNTAAKTELRHDAENARLGFPAEDLYDQDDDYFDWETSATNLRTLEDRIRTFCDTVSTRKNNDPLVINELKSFHLQGQDSVPMAGGTVFVKRKPCQYPPNARIGTDVHQHIRRFMISRQAASSSYSTLGRQNSSIGRPKSAW